MTEVLNADGSPHSTNARSTIDDDDDDFWFGLNKNTLKDPATNLPLGFPDNGYPSPQGQYCSVGSENAFGRDCGGASDQCLNAGINVEGINAEVASGQWEYQIYRC